MPELFRKPYLTAFEKFGWTGDRISQIIFGLLAKMRDSTLSDEDKIKALAGSRLKDIKRDVAFGPVARRFCLKTLQMAVGTQ